jgi:hypothetical protein
VAVSRLLLPVVAVLLAGISACGTATGTVSVTPPTPLVAATRSATAAPFPAVTTTSACPPSGVTIAVSAQDAAMGLRFTSVLLTNCGTTTYRLKGYPVFALLDKDQQPIAVRVRHGSADLGLVDPGPKPLTLRPSQSAATIVTWRNTLLADGTEPLTSAYAQIAATPRTPPQTVAFDADTGTTRLVHVTAWQRPKSSY